MDPLVVRVLAFAAAAWASAVVCAVASGLHVQRLARHEAPSVEDVRAELARATSDTARERLRAEFAERRTEAERALSLATLLPRSMARIALASGTALSLTSLARELRFAGPELVAGATLGFAGGFAGMVVCAAFGRQAKSLAADMRRHWKQVARVAEGQWTAGKPSG